MKKQKHRHSGAGKIETELGTFYICDVCGEKFENFKRKIINLYFVKFPFYCGRGEAFIADFQGIYQLIGGGGMGIVLYRAVEGHLYQLWILPAIWLFQKIVVCVLGYCDYHYWKIAQRVVVYSTQFVPTTVEILERQRNIEKILCEGLKPSVSDKDIILPSLPYKKESVLDGYKRDYAKKDDV